MNNPDFALIAALAAVRERMMERVESLRSSATVTSAESKLDVREYSLGGLRIDAYVDAELADGRALTWWLEARLEDNLWVVEPTISEHGLRGQEVIRRCESRTADSAAELGFHMTAAASELFGIGDVF